MIIISFVKRKSLFFSSLLPFLRIFFSFLDMVSITDGDDLNCWPSDRNSASIRKKHNIVEFYHQILWASQLVENEQIATMKSKNGCRVSFSTEPPTIYEYEPEYIKSKFGFFDYQIFRKRFQQHSQYQKEEQYQFISSKKSVAHQQEEVYAVEEGLDDEEYNNHRLIKTRSISEFRPVLNVRYNNYNNIKDDNTKATKCVPYSFSKNMLDSVYAPLAQIDIFYTDTNRVTPQSFYQQQQSATSLSSENTIVPPPTNMEYNSIRSYNNSNKIQASSESYHISPPDINHLKQNGGKNDIDLEPKKVDHKGQAFFQRTLRKIKSSPKLIELQRRSSIASLRKKKSFSILSS